MENDDKTRLIRRPDQPAGPPPSDTDTTRIVHRHGAPPTDTGGTHLPTRVINKQQPPPIPGQAAYQAAYEATRVSGKRYDEDKTVVLGPVTRRKQPAAEAVPSAANPEPEKSDHMHDPVVGWLAIVSGPGAGDFVRMGYGMNSIGRAEDQRCRLDLGDEKISRQSHATITYDPRGRKFFLQHGGGQNLTYLNDAPVLQPVELKGGEFIMIGNTALRFVPLCGPAFDYPEAPTAHQSA